LTAENFERLLDDLAAGRVVRVGSQTGRVSSEPAGALGSLTSLYGKDGRSGPLSVPHKPRVVDPVAWDATEADSALTAPDAKPA